jgi:hypothetical protein
VPLVHEAAADRAGSGVQILVTAPHGEVGRAVVQRERGVADGVRQVEAGEAAVRVRGARNARNVEGLPGAELHARPPDERDLPAVLDEALLDGALLDQVGAGCGREFE